MNMAKYCFIAFSMVLCVGVFSLDENSVVMSPYEHSFELGATKPHGREWDVFTVRVKPAYFEAENIDEVPVGAVPVEWSAPNISVDLYQLERYDETTNDWEQDGFFAHIGNVGDDERRSVEFVLCRHIGAGHYEEIGYAAYDLWVDEIRKCYDPTLKRSVLLSRSSDFEGEVLVLSYENKNQLSYSVMPENEIISWRCSAVSPFIWDKEIEKIMEK